MYRFSLDECTLNEKNSNKGEPQTRLDPGCLPEVAINIQSIYVEGKTVDLKKLQVGKEIVFPIVNEELTLYAPDFKAKEDREFTHYANGEGGGDIEDIELDDTLEDDEYQEVRVILRGGYAEGL